MHFILLCVLSSPVEEGVDRCRGAPAKTPDLVDEV